MTKPINNEDQVRNRRRWQAHLNAAAKKRPEPCRILQKAQPMEAFRSPGAAHEALNGHGEIFQGILDDDPSKVENAIHEHMTQGKRALLGRWSN